MKISYNWLKTYLDIDLEPEKLGEILTGIGLEVEGIEQFESVTGGLENIVIGKVLECWKHPNADKLSLNKVDIGEGEPVQIVCGAPNVEAGQKVVVAKVGAMLYPDEGKPFEIRKARIRGEESFGMICAEDELGIGEDHSGILVLSDDVEVGLAASTYFQVEKDIIFDIGLTPNRSDATSHLGVAEDLAAYLAINGTTRSSVEWPDLERFSPDNNDLVFNVTVENNEACPRYSGITISNVVIKASPDWLKNRLRAIGVRPINNIVDITNFVLHEMGQPLHAFDADEIPSQHIIVKPLDGGTPFITLDEVERKLNVEDLMICNGNSKGLCIAGVFGGVGSGVTEKTSHIFLESAHFNPKWIRKTSTRHLLRTDAAICFEKTTDPNVTVKALKRAALLMKELAGGQITSEVIDVYPNPIKPVPVFLRWERINRLIGIEIPKKKIIAVLDALNMQIETHVENGLRVLVPTNKADVTREADVIEEILRIYGFNQVPLKAKMENTLGYIERPSRSHVQRILGDFLSANGFLEMMALSLTQSKYYPDYIPIRQNELVHINNTSNVSLDIMRPELLISALETVRHNQNRQQYQIRVYEFGRDYKQLDHGQCKEQEHLTITLSGGKYEDHWLTDDRDFDFYSLKSYVHAVLGRLGISNWSAKEIHDKRFEYGLTYTGRDDIPVVEFGKVHPDLLKRFDIRVDVFFADFGFQAMFSKAKQHTLETTEISRFPSVRRDLALVVPRSTRFEDLANTAKKHGSRLLNDIGLFDVYTNPDQIGEDYKSYAINLIFEDPERTLKDSEVDIIVDKMVLAFESEFGAKLR